MLAFRGIFLAALFFLPTAAARAATWTATGTSDDSGNAACVVTACPTLRDAITSASPGDTINLTSLTGAIVLTGPELVIANSLSILGPGANTLSVQAAGGQRILEISAGNTTISGLALSGGNGAGGALDQVDGGGVLIDPSASLAVANCAVTANSSANGSGAGFYVDGGTLSVTSSTISGNSAHGTGGGIGNSGGTVTVIDSTVFGNSSVNSGGGIESDSGTLTVTSSTITGNSVSNGSGGGICNNGGAGYLLDTLVAGNSATSDSDVRGAYDQGGTVGNNLIGDLNTDASGFSAANADQSGTDTQPMALGTVLQTSGGAPLLANNGGPTPTIALVPGSPAVDAGSDAVLGGAYNLVFDQRGMARKSGTHVDIGAYEAQQPSISGIANQNVMIPGNTGALSFTVGDAVTPVSTLVVTGASSNTAVVPSNGISLQGAGANRTVIVTPIGAGSATVTLTVTDRASNFSVATSFTVNVTAASLGIGNTTVTVGASGAKLATFNVTLSQPLATAVSVSFSTANGTASAGTDYTATSGTLTIAAGTTAAAINIPALGTTVDPSGLTFTVTLSNPVNAVLGTPVGTGTIVHDVAPVDVSVTPNAAIIPEYAPELLTTTYSSVGGAANITTANLSIGKLSAPSSSLYAEYVAATNTFYVNSNGTSVGGFAPGSANVITTFLGSLNLAGTTVTKTGDTLVITWDIAPANSLAGTQGLYLDANDSFGLTSGWQDLGSWTIVTPTSASINSVNVFAGPSGTQPALFPVTLSSISQFPVTVSYVTANGTAVAGTDYTASSGTVTISAGGDSATISVPVAGGQTDASGLTFTVTISNPVNSALGASVGTATIIHDVAPANVSVLPNPATSAAGSPELLTTTCSSVAGAGNITSVNLSIGKLTSPTTSLYAEYIASGNRFYLNLNGSITGGITPGSASVITTPLGSLNLAGTTVTKSGNNLIIGWDITPTNSLIGAQGAYLNVSDSLNLTSGWQNLGTWNIQSPVSAAINSVPVVTGPSGTQHAVFAVTLNAAVPTTVTLAYTTANGTATAGTDYTAASGTLTIPAGSTTGTISVPVAGGQTDASGLTFTVTLSNPVNAFLGTATGTATIIHDVAPTDVSVAPNPVSSAVGAPQLLTTTFSSVGGAANIATGNLSIGKLSSPETSLYAEYVSSTNLFYLNSNGTSIGGYAPGSSNVITTALGSLNLAGTTVTKTGNNLVIGWDFTLTSSLLGAQGLYLEANDAFGLSSGWQNLGTWTTFAPTSASVNNVTVYSGPGGTQSAKFSITLNPVPQAPFRLSYATANGTATAGTDYTPVSGTWAGVPGNTVCTIAVPVLPTPADPSGLTFSLNLSNPIGATIAAGTGTATIIHDTVPVNVGVTPSPVTSGGNASELLTATYSSAAGASNIATASLSIGKLTSPATSLYAEYSASSNLFYLNSNGTSVGGYAPGSANVITTPLGTLNLAGTTVNKNGNNLVIGWDIAPAAGLLGAQGIYLDATDALGLTSGWQNLGAWTIVNPPANDNFANARALTGTSGSVNGTTVGATLEPGEPGPGTAGGSVWYVYTPGASGQLSLGLSNDSPVQSVAVFTGTSVSTLTPVTLAGGNVATIPGAAYFIQISNSGSNPASFALTWSWIGAPANDLFANAQAISGVSGTTSGTTLGATTEATEPGSGTSTVWYAYTAPSAAFGTASISLSGQTANQIVTAYTGTALGNLRQVGAGTNSVQFATSGATAYYVQVANINNEASVFLLNWNWAPVNDLFANATAISGASGFINGTTTGATVETGEPGTGTTSSTVWYAYTAPAGSSGQLALTLSNDAPAQSVAVFTGTSVSGLTSDSLDGAYIPVTPGTAYYIQVSSSGAAASDFTLAWSWISCPANDDFANAQVLSGNNGIVTGTTVGATLEPGELGVGGGSHSVWYQYTVPAVSAGTGLSFYLVNDSPVQNVTAYLGTSLGNLTKEGTSTPAELATSSWESLYIQVSSQGDNPGTFSLVWVLGTNGNDNFANAQAISGVSGEVSGTTVGSTVESGEPLPLNVTGTVWYEYTAPTGSTGSTGSASFQLGNMSTNQDYAVYTGTSLTNLTQLAETTCLSYNPSALSFGTEPGATYFIQVGGIGYDDSQTNFTLTWTWAADPPNDYFVNAQAISGVTGTVNGTTVGATYELGESPPYQTLGTVWYAYTSPSSSSGRVTFTVSNNAQTQFVEGFSGTALANLTPQGGNQNSGAFGVAAGTTYYVEVGCLGANASSFTLTWSFAAAPANDNFVNAQAISGATGSVNGTTLDATVETGDPAPHGVTNSVWYAYSAPTGSLGVANFTLTGNVAPNSIYVYTGTSLANLVGVPGSVNGSGVGTTSGSTYYVEVAGTVGGTFTLNWSWTAIPSNDLFANAAPISGSSGSVFGSTTGATVETGEPNPVSSNSTVWYQYTASSAGPGTATFSITNSSGAQYVAVYQGSSLGNLTQLAGANNGTSFPTVAGNSYYVQVSSNGGTPGSFTLSWNWIAEPANDYFASAQAISGATGSVSGTTLDASLETGEPNPYDATASVWYQYTAPSSAAGFVTFTNYAGVRVLAYQGTTLSNLTGVTEIPEGNGRAVFATAAGGVYYLQVPTTGPDSFTLNWVWAVPPANDNFANAQVLSPLTGSVSGTTIGATDEINEPDADSEYHTVWYKFTAPSGSAGPLAISVTDSQNVLLQAYTGTTLNNLYAGAQGLYSNLNLVTIPGTTYYIQLCNSGDVTSNFTLAWSWVPSNDYFVSANAISGASGSVNGTTTGATTQNGEPNVSGSNHTVWYSYTAPTTASGTVSFSLTGTSASQTVNAYISGPLSNLTELASGSNAASFTTSAGASYYIQVASVGDNTSNFTLSWSWLAVPSNDNFANAAQLGEFTPLSGTTAGATVESGDPAAGSGVFETVWYEYYNFNISAGWISLTLNSAQSQVINVYTGSSLANLTLVTTGTNAQSFPAAVGAEYYVEIVAQGNNPAGFTLDLAWSNGPTNDYFGSAQVITGLTGSINGTTVGATLETGDPETGSSSSTVWYQYVAPATGTGSATFSISNSSNLPLLSTYTGTSLGALTKNVVNSIHGSGSFGTTPGISYYVEVSSNGPASAFMLNWTWVSGPANDYFSSPQPISGASGSVNGTTVGSTVESLEPYSTSYVGTVWYQYTAPSGSPGFVSFSSNVLSQAPTSYTGTSFATLGGYFGNQFATTPGTIYRIQVGALGTTAPFTLSWTWNGAPANDNFASATAISGTAGLLSGTTIGATVETGDPASSVGSRQSVWYAYTPSSASAGTVSLGLSNTSASQYVAVFTGPNLTGLTKVTGGAASASFATVPGTTDFVEVYAGITASAFSLNWTWAPANDLFANAQVISGATGSATGTTIGATLESGEPNSSTAGGTVWYAYTAPTGSAGELSLALSNDSPAPSISLWTGNSVSSLTAVSGTGGNYPTASGAAYYVQVASSGGSAATFTLTWSWNVPPSNDFFANTQAISGVSGTTSGTTVGATSEVGEPGSGTSTVWYAYAAPSAAAGIATLSLSGQTANQTVTTYTGTALANLAQVATGTNGVAFSTFGATTYYVQISGSAGATSAFTLNWIWAPVNDLFANATSLTGASGTVNGTTMGASVETGEPNSGTTSNSVWYAYTPGATGQLSLTLSNDSPAQDIAVYTGNSVSALSAIPGTGGTFAATAGTTYFVQIASSGTGAADFTLSWSLLSPPSNDFFANTQAISGVSGTSSGTTVGATSEVGEPGSGTSTVWYAYTAPSPAAGTATLNLSGQIASQTVTAYTGTALANLAQAATGTNGVTFSTSGATTYYVQVSGGTGASSAFTLNWNWAPVNDLFANATSLTGASGTVNGTTTGATVETGEPNSGTTSNSVWYAYTAPSGSAGQLTLGLTNDSPAQSVLVYTGISVSTLSADGTNAGNFLTVPGATYFIQVASSGTNAADFTLTWSWLGSPANDLFANAQGISGVSGAVAGTTVGATVEAGEPGSATSTVWYAYTPPSAAAGTAILTANNGSISQEVNVYTGTALNNLAQIATGTQSVQFATAGVTTYYVQIPSNAGATSAFNLSWTWAPANDLFANATAVSGASGSVNGTTKGASVETGEPGAGSNTVWYVYTAPSGSAGQLALSLTNDTPVQAMAVYAGTSVSALTADSTVAGNYLTVSTGTYYLQVASSGANVADFTLNWSWVAIPSNDNFTGAALLSTSGSVTGTTVGATIQTGDPVASTGSNESVWYRIPATSPLGGSANLTLSNTTSAQNINVYTGSTISALTQIATGPNALEFSTQLSTPYYVEVYSTGNNPSSFTLTTSWAGAQINDNFANAIAYSGASGSGSGTTRGATVEAGDPAASTGTDHTVWFAYTAPSTSGVTTLQMLDNSGQIVFVYSGTALKNLQQLASGTSTVTFAAAAGTVYYVEVASPGDNPGSFNFQWSSSAASSNDNYANAQRINGTVGSISGTTVGATVESEDPAAGSGTTQTVWYSYNSPAAAAGVVSLTLSSSPSQTIYVYTGSTLLTLMQVGSGTNAFTFEANANAYYIIEIASQTNSPAPFLLSWTWSAAGANDNFVNAQPLAGAFGYVNGTTVGATVEAGDPAGGTGTDQTVWYSYLAPTSGVLVTGVSGNVYFYSGTSLATLTNITSTVNSSTGVLPTTPGTIYYIEVTSYGNNPGTFSLNWDTTPANDDFANAQPLSGLYGSFEAVPIAATLETGEPNSVPGDGSVWYSYTTPGGEPGLFLITIPSQFGCQLNIYSGTSLANLTQVYGSDFSGSLFLASGTTYYIQYEGPQFFTDYPSDITWSFDPGPANDYFADAQAISGVSGSVSGTTLRASVEPGEPNSSAFLPTVWYQYTAPTGSAGTVTFTQTNAPADQELFVFTGTAVNALTTVTGGLNSSPISFTATPGATYYIQVYNGYMEGTFTLNWSWTASGGTSSYIGSSRLSKESPPYRNPSAHSS